MPSISAPAVQQKIDIEEIQDGLVRLKGGAWRAVLMATSMNFSLKSTEEQEAIIYHYQSFLNALDFSVQILAVSRRLDISSYLAALEQKRREQENELLRIQTAEYLDFVKNLVQISQIMSQSFYLIVPLAPTEQENQTLSQKFSGLLRGGAGSKETKSVEELKNQLWQRVNYMVAALAGVGLKAAPLNNEEIIQLFYRLYNMGLKEKPTFEIGERK